MPERESETPTFTRIEPIWTPLGIEHTQHGPRYWFRLRGRERRFRAGDLYGLTFLAEVYPDMEHWRRQFPYGVGRRVDTHAAMAYFVRKCEEAGEYVPMAAGVATAPTPRE